MSSEPSSEKPELVEAKHIEPPKWSRYAIEIYMKRQPPMLGTVDWKQLQENARQALKDYPGNHHAELQNSVDRSNA
jgi:hypothetical protein